MGTAASTCLSISLLISLGHQVSSITMSQNAFLKPNILSSNGATITTLADDTACTPSTSADDACWSLEADSPGNRGFHLQLSLDDSWSFESTANTTLKIEIRFNCNTVLKLGSDLVVAFSRSDSNQYFANLLTVGTANSEEDEMYPLCSTPPAYSRFASGDPIDLVQDYSSKTRWEKITDSSSSDLNNRCNSTSSDTLMLTLKNHPSSHMLYSFEKPNADPVECAFSSSTGISNIYFGSLVTPQIKSTQYIEYITSLLVHSM